MPSSVIDTLIFRDIFGSKKLCEVWSDGCNTQEYNSVPDYR